MSSPKFDENKVKKKLFIPPNTQPVIDVYAKQLNKKAGVTILNFNPNANLDFIRTSEFFALNNASLKTGSVMPLPHVTLRKKDDVELEVVDEAGSRRTGTDKSGRPGTADPMASTLQKWRESRAEEDNNESRAQEDNS